MTGSFVDIDVLGVNTAIAELAAAGVAAEVIVANGVADGAEMVADAARSIVPVDTGTLRDSIEVVANGDTADVVVGAEYGPYVEFGTSDTPAQPFLRPALDSETDRVTSQIGRGLAAL